MPVMIRLSRPAADDASVLSLDLSQKVPFQVEEAADLSSLKLRLFSTTGHTNWIVYDQADDFVRQVNWSQPETGLTEVDILLGDATKARKTLNWSPKVSFDQLIDMMVGADLEIAAKEKTLLDAGYASGNHRMG